MSLSTDSKSLLDISNLKMAAGKKVAIIATEWNDKIVAEQINGAKRIANQVGAQISKIIYVPGSFELPFAARQLGQQHHCDAIILFGAVIRGGTPHFEYVSKAVTDGTVALNLSLQIPVIFGVLTLDTEEQAWERLGGSHGHKGEEAMISALKMTVIDYQ